MDEFREIGDVPATRQAIWDRTLDAASKVEPVSNSQYTLTLGDVRWQGPDTLPKSAHKKALMNGSYLTRKLAGTWTLTDNKTGEPVSKKRCVIAHIPYMTDLGTFVRGGNDYTMAHQLRLKPGVYTRWLDNDQLEAHVNVSKGLGHKVFFEPESGVFKIRIGQASIPIVTVLDALGASRQDMKNAWGEQLYEENRDKEDPKAVNKLYDKVSYGRGEAVDPGEKMLAIQRAFLQMGLDPEVSALTLGKPYDHVNKDVLLDTTSKLLRIYKGEQDTDSRDDMAYQKLFGPEDLIADKFKNSPFLLRQHLWKASQKNNLDKMPAGVFDPSVTSALIGSGLGLPVEGINPIELFDNQYRVTRMGEGGIPSLDAVPASARNVHPSQMGILDPIRTPESLKVGVDSRLAGSLRKGRDGNMYTQVLDKAGRKVWRTSSQLARASVAFPNAFNSKYPFIPAVRSGRLVMLPREDIDYTYPTMQGGLHGTGRLVPLMSSVKGQRAVMAARMITQALPLENREAPLVQSGMPDEDDKSYEEFYGTRFGALRAKEPCTVVKVTPDEIVTKDASGKTTTHDLYRDLVFNRKTGMTQTPTVVPGDVLKPGSLMATSNFTDKDGTTAVGINARIAFLPFKGLNYEDAIVVSESFAKKMASQHYYKNKLPSSPDMVFDTQKFISIKPGVYSKEQLENFSPDGIIKPGTVVHTGDPLILAINKVEPSEAQKKMGRKLHWRDSSVTWDHHDAGIVTDVYHDGKGAQVVVKSKQQLQVADKISGRYGNKGVSQVVPDEELPTLPDGTKPDVLMTSLAIVGRVNPGFAEETMLGKIAKKTGKRYAVKDFADRDLADFVQKEADKYGVKFADDLIDNTDPDHPKVIPNVLNGYTYMMKLHHSVESKAQGRGIGRYTTDMQPAKGGDDGAKRVGMLELSALLSHGALRNIADLKYVKGQENTDYWRQYLAGYNPPTPRVPYVYHKFINYLEGAGMHIQRKGPRLNIMALTSKDVDTLAGDRELKGVKDPRTGLQTLPTVSWDNGLKPLPGGLFDPDMTGGHAGNQWSYIRLDNKYPNPVMELPLRLMLNMTEEDFRDVMAGKETLPTGTGPEGIYNAACALNIENEITRARNDIKSGRKTYRDAAVRRLGYLKTAQKLGQEPKDWFMDKVPVLPPYFRPVSQMGGEKMPLVSDANYLYKQLFDTNQTYRMNRKVFGDKESGDLGLEVYDAFKAVTGLGEPTTTELRQKEVKGLLKSIFGPGAKFSMMQTKLLGTPVDMAGRSTIVPDPDMDMDTIGLPENVAWDTYKPFVIREMRKHGRNGIQALSEVDSHTEAARSMLKKVMEERPVLLNRAPTLHKFGLMAMLPKLVKGDAIKITPFICRGMGADHDGNCCDFDTNITIVVPKSIVDKNYELFKNISASRAQCSVIHLDEKDIEMSIFVAKIGTFPHYDTFTFDKNGARIYDVPDEMYVLSCNPQTGIPVYSRVTHLTIEDDCPTQEVTIGNRKVIVSTNESLTCFDRDTGSLKRITPEQGREELIPVLKKDPTPFGTYGNRDLGWWLGALISDGWISNRTVGYTKLEVGKRNEFVRISRDLHPNFSLYEYSDTNSDNKLGDSSKIHLNGRSFSEFASQFDILEAGESRAALRKKIPESLIQDGSEEFLWGLMSGLIDGDGCLVRNMATGKPRFNARFSTSSPYLKDSFISLCYRLGLRFSVTVTPPRNHSKEAYTIMPSTVDMYDNLDKLSVIGERETCILRDWKSTDRPVDSKDIIPVSKDEVATISKYITNKSDGSLTRVLRETRKKVFSVSRSVLDRYSELLMKVTPELYTRVQEKNTCWFCVSDIKDTGLRQVFDLAVEGTKVFCTNLGVIIQDTMVFHVPTSDEAVQEALEKMLPSHNLLAPGDFTAMPTITKEHLIGLYEATRLRDGLPKRTFRNTEDVVAAWKRGEIGPSEKVRIMDK